jgi:hypothetical protein
MRDIRVFACVVDKERPAGRLSRSYMGQCSFFQSRPCLTGGALSHPVPLPSSGCGTDSRGAAGVSIDTAGLDAGVEPRTKRSPWFEHD